ncbi:MAG: hypothetical protein LBC42_03925 [Puniceicoccales bacterium]|jgi:hypothetical protein|nr:hypothetical protein [Puniceicoccales bacterium]
MRVSTSSYKLNGDQIGLVEAAVKEFLDEKTRDKAPTKVTEFLTATKSNPADMIKTGIRALGHCRFYAWLLYVFNSDISVAVKSTAMSSFFVFEIGWGLVEAS